MSPTIRGLPMPARELTGPIRGALRTGYAIIVAVFSLLVSTVVLAQEKPDSDSEPQKQAPTAFATNKPKPVLNWGVGDGKSFAVPALEVVSYEFLLNRFDHYAIDHQTYENPISNFRDNVHHKWVVDNDKFSTNQFLHPYQGGTYQAFARSAGLGFWESAAYTLGGSLMWEEAGETTRPSINDEVATGIGGLFFGEPLFRMASLLLESDPRGTPGTWREWLV